MWNSSKPSKAVFKEIRVINSKEINKSVQIKCLLNLSLYNVEVAFQC